MSLLDVYKEDVEPGEKIACRMGCAFCCYIPVECTEQEARLAYEASDPSAVREAISSRGDTNFESCPFLRDNQCTVYEVRPLACRQYTSVSAMDCAKAHFERDDKAKIGTDRRTMAYWRSVADRIAGERKFLHQWLENMI